MLSFLIIGMATAKTSKCDPSVIVCAGDRPPIFVDERISYPFLLSPRNSKVSGSFSLILDEPVLIKWFNHSREKTRYLVAIRNMETWEEWQLQTFETQIAFPSLPGGQYGIIVRANNRSSVEERLFVFDVANQEEQSSIAAKLAEIPDNLSEDEMLARKLEICLEFDLIVEAIALLESLPILSSTDVELLGELYARIGLDHGEPINPNPAQ